MTLRAAVEAFLSVHYPNNGDGRASHLTWTIPEKACGDLRRAFDADAVSVDAERLHEVAAMVMHATLRSMVRHTGSDAVCDECRTDTAELLAALAPALSEP